jgi:hypothetical protein
LFAVKKPILELLKDLSALIVGAAAVLYIFGYIVHLAYFRLLGIEMPGQPLDYVRLAADYSASVISSLPQLIISPQYYLPKLFHSPLLRLTICLLVLVTFFLVTYLPIGRIRRIIDKPRTSKSIPLKLVTWSLVNLSIVVCLFVLMALEIDVAKCRDVLQTVEPADIQQMQNQVIAVESLQRANADLLELRTKYLVNALDKYADTHKDSPGFQNWRRWFNPKGRPNNSAERSSDYLALLLINLVILIVIIYQVNGMRRAPDEILDKVGMSWRRTLVFVLGAGIVFQGVLFPFMYATLGRYFVYPVVRLKLVDEHDNNTRAQEQVSVSKSGSVEAVRTHKPAWTHGVYLIAQSDSEIVVYDRLNFFQVKHVPRSQISSISQLFNASPFESCSKVQDEFTPCEILWMSEEQPVLDF